MYFRIAGSRYHLGLSGSRTKCQFKDGSVELTTPLLFIVSGYSCTSFVMDLYNSIVQFKSKNEKSYQEIAPMMD